MARINDARENKSAFKDSKDHQHFFPKPPFSTSERTNLFLFHYLDYSFDKAQQLPIMRFIVQLLLVSPLVSGFMPSPMTVKPGLSELVDSLPGRRVSINLNIGQEGDTSRLAISGMVLDLIRDSADAIEHVAMPGKNGPHPNLSSGIRRLNLVEEGSFVSLMGTQAVKTVKGCWEMVWRKESPAGAILCGFEIPEDYNRNDATLPKGRIYLSFPVWTKETLAEAKVHKDKILKRAEQLLQEKNLELEKVQETNNPLMKALHYRNAYAAAEKYMMQPVARMKEVPEEDEVFALQDNLLLTAKGLVWSKVLPRGEQVLLGTANISPVFAKG